MPTLSNYNYKESVKRKPLAFKQIICKERNFKTMFYTYFCLIERIAGFI